jgi:hypothetical protein
MKQKFPLRLFASARALSAITNGLIGQFGLIGPLGLARTIFDAETFSARRDLHLHRYSIQPGRVFDRQSDVDLF